MDLREIGHALEQLSPLELCEISTWLDDRIATLCASEAMFSGPG